MRRERREAFRDRYGDWGRDLALWAGRHYGGLMLRELGAGVGDVHYTAVAMAIRRLHVRSRHDRSLHRRMLHVTEECEK